MTDDRMIMLAICRYGKIPLTPIKSQKYIAIYNPKGVPDIESIENPRRKINGIASVFGLNMPR